jgi:hypothetical protein
MYFNKFIKIKFNQKDIAVYLNDELFLKQDYINDKNYTFFLVVLILSKYGLVNYYK